MISIDNRNKQVPTEVVVFDGGKIYKAPTNKELASNYVKDVDASTVFPFKKIDGKKYYWSKELKDAYFSGFEVKDNSEDADFTGLDICPAIEYLDAIGIADNSSKDNCDMFFTVSSMDMLQKVSEYYKLPFPLNEEQKRALENNLDFFAFLQLPERAFTIGGVKFVNGLPSVLKMYLYPKHYNGWQIWMNGEAVHNNGSTLELGVSIRKGTGGPKLKNFNNKNKGGTSAAELIYSIYKDKKILYKLEYTYDDTLHWTGLVVDDELNVLDRRNFRSTALGRKLKLNFFSPVTEYENELPEPPAGTYGWIGYSWFDSNVKLKECYFLFMGDYDKLDAIAASYNLPVPYKEKEPVFDIRASHYKVPLIGDSVPLTVCGVVFNENGTAEDLVLYKFKRRLEFDDPLEVPDVKPIIDKLLTTDVNLF